MAFKFSTEVRRQQCVVGSLKTILDGSVLRLYSGPVPASADSGLAGNTLLMEIAAAGGAALTFESVASGATLVKSLNEVWSGSAIASGDVTFFRMVKGADTGMPSTSETRVQGTVGGPDADLTMSNPALTTGDTRSLSYFAIALLESA